MIFLDDYLNGYFGGNVDWVYVINRGYGNVKVGYLMLILIILGVNFFWFYCCELGW